MLRYLLLAAGACACVLLQSASATDRESSRANSHYRIVAYVAGGAPLPAIHPEKLTHINFAFAHIDAHGRAAIELPAAAQTLRSLRALQAQNPKLKIIVSVGGWRAEGFSDAALTDSSRLEFARSAVLLIRDNA